MTHALSNLHVVEFAAYAAGPVIGKFLGNHGATVIHVESASRPDGFRQQYPPFKDNKPGLNRAALFALCNDSTLGVTVDLKNPHSRIAKEALVKWADVIIENFTPGTMERLGLDYKTVSQLNPRLIMLSTSNMGQRGPYAKHPGFGSQLSSYAGFTHLTGYGDDPPTLLYGPYIDYIAVGMGMAAVLAALVQRERTRRGQHIDLSQLATGVHFMASPLLDVQINGVVATRRGHWHRWASPYGVFPCEGEDRWCAISVYADSEWIALKHALGDPDWAETQEDWNTVMGRLRDRDVIAMHLAAWTRTQDVFWVVRQLQSFGVHSAVVLNVDELYQDPQLAERQFWRPLEHATLGPFNFQGPSWQLSETPWEIRAPSPLLGEHNIRVFEELLALDPDTVRFLVESGVLEELPHSESS